MPNATVESLLAQAEVELKAAERRREVARATTAYIINTASQEGRAALSAEEQQQAADAQASREQARRDIADIKGKIAHLRGLEAEDAEYAAESQRSAPGATPLPPSAPSGPSNGDASRAVQRGDGGRGYDHQARIGSEPRTYSQENDPYGRQFLIDVARGQMFNDPAAQARLARHMAEERVERTARVMETYQTRAAGDANTGNFAGLTVPQYLTDMYAPVARALRPFADICNKHPLPASGMALDISRITTGTSVALQANELDTASATSADDTLLTIPVQTAAGQQRVSRQAIDRGTGIEDVLMQDLFAALGTTLDNTLITQASTGLSSVAQANTCSTASAAAIYPQIMAGASGVESNLLARGFPTHAVMHSRRWYYLASQMVTSWPFINSAGIPEHATGTANPASAYNSGVRGRLPIGLDVVVDNNIATNLGVGTNQDEIYVVPAMECHLWEDPAAPVFIRADQVAAPNLGVLLVVWEYFAYTLSRFSNAMQKVSGAGLVTPVFS
jgi:hypothetical protein